jgi:hypothetical protein
MTLRYLSCPSCRRRLLILPAVRSLVCACGKRIEGAGSVLAMNDPSEKRISQPLPPNPAQAPAHKL